MSIDWSKAPEGAEAAHPGNPGVYPAWYRRDVAGLVEQICPMAGILNWTWMGCRRDFPIGSLVRPKNSDPAWVGIGLPPVGTVCEVVSPGYSNDRFDRFVGQLVTIVAHDVIDAEPVAVFRMSVNGQVDEQEYHAMVAKCFRPARTPEQIAAEERDKAIAEMVDALGCDPEASKTGEFIRCGLLYDAGYRRQEAK